MLQLMAYASATPKLPEDLKLPEVVSYFRLSMKPKGFPQGAPISPILSILGLETTLFRLWSQMVQFADDGIFYGGNLPSKDSKGLLFEVEDEDGVIKRAIEGRMHEIDPEWKMLGIQLHPGKSGWVKRNGK